MSNDDRTQWAVRYPDGHVAIAAGEFHAVNLTREANYAIAEAHGSGEAVVVSRVRSVTYTEWEAA